MIELKQRLIDQALAEGFDLCRLCRPGDVPYVPARLEAFLKKGYHGQMGWLGSGPIGGRSDGTVARGA